MEPTTFLTFLKGVKDGINNKIEGVTGGIQQAAGIYGGGSGFGYTPSNQQAQQVPVFSSPTDSENTNMSVPPQYGLPTTNYKMPNGTLASKILGRENEDTNGLFQRLMR